MQVITVTPDELKCIITDALESILRENATRPEKEQLIVDSDYITQKLGITRQTLTAWRNKNKIPFIKLGGIIRYDFNKVIEALESKKGRALK